jgi:hypothetical protein
MDIERLAKKLNVKTPAHIADGQHEEGEPAVGKENNAT